VVLGRTPGDLYGPGALEDTPPHRRLPGVVGGVLLRERSLPAPGALGLLLAAAVGYVRSQGALAIEGYPVEPGPRSYTYMGSPTTFAAAGFSDVTPAGQRRRVVRLALARPRR